MNRDPFDTPADLGMDPIESACADAATRPKKKKWRRRFIKVPWSWVDRLKTSNRGATYRVALHLIYAHWRAGGRPIHLANITLAEEGVNRRAKWRALGELERFGLVKIERRSRKAPLVTLIVDPRTADP